jgi:hypothetical protein
MKESILNQIVKVRLEDLTSEHYNENRQKASRLHGDGELCPLCGKYLKNYDQLFEEGKIIHMFNGGEHITDQSWSEIFPEDVANELDNDPGEMAWFPVGADCYRRFKKAMEKARSNK